MVFGQLRPLFFEPYRSLSATSPFYYFNVQCWMFNVRLLVLWRFLLPLRQFVELLLPFGGFVGFVPVCVEVHEPGGGFGQAPGAKLFGNTGGTLLQARETVEREGFGFFITSLRFVQTGESSRVRFSQSCFWLSTSLGMAFQL